MPGEICFLHVTPSLNAVTLPSTWTPTCPEATPWGLFIWRASMWLSRATGPSPTMVTLVSLPPFFEPLFHQGGRRLTCCSQSSCRLAAAWRWAAGASRTSTTPSSCTSTGGARPPTARSTRWTDADTRWRYSPVSRWLCGGHEVVPLWALRGFCPLNPRCTSSAWSPSIPTCPPHWRIQQAWLFSASSSTLVLPKRWPLTFRPCKLTLAVLQVVYADNVHFGHISQMLSSVAYKGQRKRVCWGVIWSWFLLWLSCPPSRPNR